MNTTDKKNELMKDAKKITEKMFTQWDGALKGVIDKVVSEGRITKTEGKKLIDEYTEQFVSERVKIENRFEKEVGKVLKKLILPTKKRLSDVTDKLAELEDEINRLEDKGDSTPVK